jgi:adenylate kinase family enzyme
MRRVVILGRGGAGKSTLARELSALTGLPAVDLDSAFWQHGPQQAPAPAAAEEWEAVQQDLVSAESWILDGDLGPYDSGLWERLAAADTIIVLDFGLARCAWRSLRRGHEEAGYWRWVLLYRRQYLPELMAVIAEQLPRAQAYLLRNPAGVRRFLAEVRSAAQHGHGAHNLSDRPQATGP